MYALTKQINKICISFPEPRVKSHNTLDASKSHTTRYHPPYPNILIPEKNKKEKKHKTK